MKKLIAAITTGLVAIALVVAGVAAPASAHTATLSGSATCNTDGSATITWTIDNDWNEVVKVTASNDSSIPVGSEVAAKTGNTDTTGNYQETVPAPAASKSVTATLSFLWIGDNYTQNNTSYTVKVSSDCKAQLTKDASASVSTNAAACGAAETAEENTVTNATWTSSSTSGGTFTAVATANSGHAFSAAGQYGALSSSNTVDTFTVKLASALPADRCKTAAASVTTNPATCTGAETAGENSGITNATWTSSNTSGSTFTAVATANSGFEFSTAGQYGTLSQGGTVDTFTVTLDAQVTGHPCEDYIIVAWTMPSWDNSTTPTWPQQIFAHQEETTTNLNALDSLLTEECGVQYQVDIYYNSAITASLIQGGYLDGPDNPQEDLISGGWGVAYKLVDGPDCANPVTPTETDTCNNGGSITITPALGVTYAIDGNTVTTTGTTPVSVPVTDGPHTVTAAATTGYLLQNYPANGWSFDVSTNCGASYSISGVCSWNDDQKTSNEDVTLVFNNPSSTAATFVVTTPDASGTAIYGNGSYIVPAGTLGDTQDVGSTTSAGGTFIVTINGGTQDTVVVDSFTTCIPVTPADPTYTQAVCDGNNIDGGSITVDGNPDIVYTLNDSKGLGTYTTTPFPTTSPFTISGLAPDTYTVVATPINGYVLTTPSDFPFDVVIATSVKCDGTPLTPSVTVGQPSCAPDVQLQSTGLAATAGKFQADDTEIEGTLTLGQVSQVTWTINGVGETSGSAISEPDGPYDLVATLTPAAVTEGYTFAASTGTPAYTLSANDTVATFVEIVFAGADDCSSLPTEATVDAGVTPTNATCTATSAVDGVLDLEHDANQAGDVTYVVTNDATNQVVYTGSGSNNADGDYLLNVTPGTYTVVATPIAGDGISGNTGNTDSVTYGPFTITQDGTDCDGTLAFTGGTIAWLGFILAGGMLFLGFALMFMRRRGHRTAE